MWLSCFFSPGFWDSFKTQIYMGVNYQIFVEKTNKKCLRQRVDRSLYNTCKISRSNLLRNGLDFRLLIILGRPPWPACKNIRKWGKKTHPRQIVAHSTLGIRHSIFDIRYYWSKWALTRRAGTPRTVRSWRRYACAGELPQMCPHKTILFQWSRVLSGDRKGIFCPTVRLSL